MIALVRCLEVPLAVPSNSADDVVDLPTTGGGLADGVLDVARRRLNQMELARGASRWGWSPRRCRAVLAVLAGLGGARDDISSRNWSLQPRRPRWRPIQCRQSQRRVLVAVSVAASCNPRPAAPCLLCRQRCGGSHTAPTSTLCPHPARPESRRHITQIVGSVRGAYKVEGRVRRRVPHALCAAGRPRQRKPRRRQGLARAIEQSEGCVAVVTR